MPSRRASYVDACLIDPLSQTIEVLRLEHERWSIIATAGGTDVIRAEPFDAIELEVSRL